MSGRDFYRILSFFIFPAIVFFLAVIIFIFFEFNVIDVIPWLDIPTHFIGGISIAYTSVLLLRFFNERETIVVRSEFVFFIIVIALVSLSAVLWEFFEFVIKYFFNLNLQPSLDDLLLDLFMGFSGGILGGFAFRYLNFK